tara:strand:+ start:7401 stop:8357 length:957 start_codon:yes stop_codon:yes gene_type:complete
MLYNNNLHGKKVIIVPGSYKIKEYISHKLSQYMSWHNYEVEIYNIINKNISKKQIKQNILFKLLNGLDIIILLIENEEDIIYYKNYFEILMIDIINPEDICTRIINTSKLSCHISTKTMYFMFNLCKQKRIVWLSRHGESQYNVENRIGGDSDITEKGKKYADNLGDFFSKIYKDNELKIWTSELIRTKNTAKKLNNFNITNIKILNEIDAGDFENFKFSDVEKYHNEEFNKRKKDKFYYRYPNGESYEDLVRRLDPILHEIMHQNEPLLIVAHQAVLRIIYGYLTGKKTTECPNIFIPQHKLLKITIDIKNVEEIIL